MSADGLALSAALLSLAVLSIPIARQRGHWRPIAVALWSCVYVDEIDLIGCAIGSGGTQAFAHALWPGAFAWLAWATHRPRDHARRAIMLAYALAAVTLGATWSASWRAPALYELAMVATRWVAALLVTLAWVGAEKDEGRPSCHGRPRVGWGHPPSPSGSAHDIAENRKDSRSTPLVNGHRAVASILGGGHAIGLIGAWAAGNPWRDWYLARGLTCAEYAVCAVVMAVALLRRRVRADA